MKKLLVTAIGAAVAFGAFADYTNAQRFEGMTVGPTDVTTLGSYWSELPNSTNTYAIVEMDAGGQTINHPDAFKNETDPANALSVKTTFGKPLSFNVLAGGAATNLESNLFFDSLVKFTVCEDVPADSYANAKIIMWLQEAQDASGNATRTNLMVRAGYLADGGVVATNYTCGNTISADFADKWHRVTIKAMPTISKSAVVPGFAIFIDGGNNTMEASSDDSKWDTAPDLTEAAEHYGETKLFPSLIQDSEDTTKLTLTSASFDGTGTLNDMVFTSVTPGFTEAEDYVAPKASVTINGSEQTGIVTLADAIDAANGAAQGAEVEITLAKGFDFDAPVTIKPTNTGVSVVLDFNGFVIENTGSECLITNAAVLTVTDSSVGATGGIVGKAIYQGDGSLTINGGKFWTLNAFDLSEATTVSIAGGSFKDDDTAFETGETESGTWIADGMTLQYNSETGLNDVVEKTTTYAAQIGESKYETLAEALAEAKAGDTIELLTDATATAAVSTAAGTLDLGDYTLTLSNVTEIAFTGTGAKAIVNGDVMGVYHELTITAPAGENLTFDSVKFHASVKPHGSGALFTATGCQFLCDFDKKGGVFTDGSSEDVHSYGVLFDSSSLFTQADIVNNYFDQGRRAAVQAYFAGDLYFYGNTVVADKLTSRVDGATTRYPALQTMTHGRVFIENNTFSGQYLGEAFCLYNKGGYRSTDAAVVFSGNTVGNGVNYLWGIYDVDKSGDAALVAPNLYFGANTVDANVDTTGCIYKTTVDGTDMNGVTYSHTPATLALPAGVDSVYAWTHAAGAKDIYVNGEPADAVAAGTVIAVPGAAVASDTCILTADATLKNKYTAAAAAAKIGNTLYATLKDAVDAANAGDTVTTLTDCTVAEPITFTKGITVSNDYTVTVANNGSITYAYRVINGTTTPVTLCGNGTFTESGSPSGSQFLVGFTKTRYETAATAGSLVLNGCTVTNGQSNVIKVENGTFTMNGGTINAAGLRAVKADGEDGANSATVTINGGTINSTKAAVAVSSKADGGAATATITGGTIAGPVTDEASAVALSSITIPGTSTAKFSVQPAAAYVASGYETVLSDGWYVVTAVKPSGIDPASDTPSAVVTAASADAAIEAVAVVAPTGVDAAAYKANFDFTATPNGDGTFTVTLTGIKEEVQEAVSKDAVDVLTSDKATTVDVPAGLCYKVTTYTALGGAAVETKSGTSEGTGVSVSKPGTTQGFIKVELSTKPLN